MPPSREERDRILTLLEIGQIDAHQAAQLLDALASEPIHPMHPFEKTRERTLRIRATHLSSDQQRVHMLASLPLNLIRHSLRLGVQMFPTLSDASLAELLLTIEQGATGRLLDLQDLEHGERLEIFVE